jgi:hypothetical protein
MADRSGYIPKPEIRNQRLSAGGLFRDAVHRIGASVDLYQILTPLVRYKILKLTYPEGGSDE